MRILATDFDGTLATSGRVTDSTLEALRKWKSSGRRIVLVTGREGPEIKRVFPEYKLCDRIVAENGALLIEPRSSAEELLASPADQRLADRLRRAGVSPLSVGRSVIALRDQHLGVADDLIRELRLDVRAILNKGSVMILPTGTDKASGLRRALEALAARREDAIGIGDAENDIALFEACGAGVAVANALPSLKSRATWVASRPEGAGVEELIDRILHEKSLK